MNIRSVRIISRIMVAAMLYVSVPFIPVSEAAIVTTDQLAMPVAGDTARDRIRTFLERDEVRAELQAHGVSAADARARVDTMTDEEAQRIAGRLDTLPAGGTDLLGVAFAVFIILLITDILGLTKVFPFTRSAR